MKKWIPYTRFEYLIAAALLLIIASHVLRFTHAETVRQWEEQFFEAIGLGGAARFLVLVPLGIYVFYRRYRESALEVEAKGQPAVRWQVWAIAVAGLIAAFAWVLLIKT